MSVEQAYFFSVALINLVFALAGTRVKEHKGNSNSILFFMVSFFAYFVSWFVYIFEMNKALEIVGAMSASIFVWGMVAFASKRCFVSFPMSVLAIFFTLQCSAQIYAILQADLTAYLHVSAVFLPIAFFTISYMFLKLKAERHPSDVLLGYAFIFMAVVILGRSILLETSPELFAKSSIYTQIIWPAFCAVIGVFSLLSYTEEAQLRLKKESNTDHLTGLANRRMFEMALSSSLAHFKRTNQYGAVIYLDLDRFKPVNDEYGHHVGDLLLSELGSRIQTFTREDELAARLGGDEFALLLSFGSSSEINMKLQAKALASRLQELIKKPFEFAEGTINITGSIGIHIIDPECQNAEKVMTAADNAMYQSKDLQNGYIIFSNPVTRVKGSMTASEV
ncbi:GGDEF domain-containing protein [Vibrio sp. RC27]